jgi:hypothetical protein
MSEAALQQTSPRVALPPPWRNFFALENESCNFNLLVLFLLISNSSLSSTFSLPQWSQMKREAKRKLFEIFVGFVGLPSFSLRLIMK